jgi:GNAT superfamily N-acetyltransferase
MAPLGAADLQAALGLVRECGWNQVEDDWAWFLRHGEAFKVEGPAGLAATAATLPYAPRFGWISMVLVGQAHRRQGIATTLLKACVARLRQRGLVPVLDATPAGREVYRQMGFHDGWAITRWRRAACVPQQPWAGSAGMLVRPLAGRDWPQIRTMDSQAFGADRGALLQHLASRSGSFACVAEQGGRILGYLLGRDGRVATQVGPVVAADADVAQALAAHALARIDGPVLMDVLDRHSGLTQQLAAAGFAVERGYTRMAFGQAVDFGDAQRTIAIAGPELG